MHSIQPNESGLYGRFPTTCISYLNRCLLILLTTIFCYSTSSAQVYIPSHCDCLTFVYACTGQPATALIGSTVTVWCGEYDDDYTITNSEGNAVLCVREGFSCGSLISPQLCISDDYWEACSISGCTVYVEQTLTVEPHINGVLLGYGEYLVPGQSGNILCEGRNYTGALNTINGATDLFICPGDDVILELEDLDIPSTSGMCLFVEIETSTGTPIDGEKFDYSKVSNGEVDLTDLFDGLATGDIYIIKIRLKCCEGDACFGSNAYRYAYIQVEGKFAYEPFATDNQSTTFVPATSPPGTQLPSPYELGSTGIFINDLVFLGNDVINPDDIDIDFEFWSTECDGNPANDELLDNGTIDGSDPFSTGSIVWVSSVSGCQCYRLDITYDDGCSENPVTDSYYFKDGEDCFGPNDPPVDKLIRPTDGGFDIGLKINPVADNQLVFEWSGDAVVEESPFELSIHDASGRFVASQQVFADGRQLSVGFDAMPGIYFYSVHLDGQVYSGKFTKL